LILQFRKYNQKNQTFHEKIPATLWQVIILITWFTSNTEIFSLIRPS